MADEPLYGWFKAAIFGSDDVLSAYGLAVGEAAGVVIFLFCFAVPLDFKRGKKMKYGRLLRGPVMSAPREFNEILKGEGLGIRTNEKGTILRLPLREEAKRFNEELARLLIGRLVKRGGNGQSLGRVPQLVGWGPIGGAGIEGIQDHIASVFAVETLEELTRWVAHDGRLFAVFNPAEHLPMNCASSVPSTRRSISSGFDIQAIKSWTEGRYFRRWAKIFCGVAVAIVWSAVRLQAQSLSRVIWVCANVSGLFVGLLLLAIMESARRWSTKWVELRRVRIATQA